MKYFWADTHFGHARILGYEPKSRPYKTVEEMNESLIARWNLVVGEADDIYLLGDFSFEKDPRPTFNRLAGRKHLVVGNHDEKRKPILNLPWESISDLVTVKEYGVRAVCCHYPLESWSQAAYGALMLHGHTHGNLKRIIPRRFDVGVDVMPFPVSMLAISQLASFQTFQPQDHHSSPAE